MTALDIEHLKPILADVVDALPGQEREVLNATFWEGVTKAEVARRLGKSERQVNRIYKRALARIRRLVDDQ